MAGERIKTEGIAEVQAVLRLIEKDKLNEARGELRKGSQNIAKSIIIPELKRGAAGAGSPLAPIMADTARAKADRIVVVKIGAVNPRGLRGYRPRSKGTGKNYRTNLAFGSNYGPAGPRANNFGIPRNDGIWVENTINSGGTIGKARQAYQRLLWDILKRYS